MAGRSSSTNADPALKCSTDTGTAARRNRRVLLELGLHTFGLSFAISGKIGVLVLLLFVGAGSISLL